MVGLNPSGPARDRVLALMQQKERIENELKEQHLILETNNIGMSEALVDNEGYPRADIDVYKVRHARNRIICLQNDHTALMKRIEQGLNDIHADLRNATIPIEGLRIDTNSSTSTNGHTNGFTPEPMDCGEASQNGSVEAFAVIGTVQDGSPADLGGLQQDDQVLQFGTITHQNFRDVSQIQTIVTHSVGQNIQVKVRRLQYVLNLSITPRPWSQPGLLGCRINRL